MAVRFRKSFKLAPGVRMNLSGGGIGWTLGARSASVGIGKKGIYLNTGIPGSGPSLRETVGGSSRSQDTRSSLTTTSLSIAIGIHDDGTLYFKDASGQQVPDHLRHSADNDIRVSWCLTS
jgi:hypothetical protein